MDEVSHGVHSDRQRMAERLRGAADSVWTSLLSGYGPHGGLRLLDLGDDVQILRSAASGLNEQALDADLAPFQDLARSVRSAVGDGATTATLLAAGLVRAGSEAEPDGIPRPVIVEGIRLAKRQTVALLRSMAQPSDPATCLAHATPLDPAAVDAVVSGIQAMAEGTHRVDLDDVDVVVEADIRPAWADSTLVTPQHGPDERRATNVGVLVVDTGWTLKPRSDGMVHRVQDAGGLSTMRNHESSRRRAMIARLQDLGVGLLVCGGKVDEELCLNAARAGIWVQTDAPRSLRTRLAAATGATSVPALDQAEGEAVGRADLRRRKRPREGFWADGPRTSATLLLPGGLPHAQASVADEGERLLRAAGVVLTDPRTVPGGGGWQRRVAQGLRASSVHAKGKHPLVVELVAQVFDRMADGLLENAGRDPLNASLLPGAETVGDAAACVDHAVMAAFEAAISMLRIDGRHDKRASNPEALRGGMGPAGSPKGMPGDIPPLM